MAQEHQEDRITIAALPVSRVDETKQRSRLHIITGIGMR